MAEPKTPPWFWRKRSPRVLIWTGIAFCVLAISEAISVRFYLHDPDLANNTLIGGIGVGVWAIHRGYKGLQQDKAPKAQRTAPDS
jgi:hypothetical protein